MGTRTLISADRMYDGCGSSGNNVISNGAALVEGDRIVAAGPVDAVRAQAGEGVETQHFAGCTLMPGLIDVHSHLVMPGTGEQIMEWSANADETLLLTAARNVWLALQAGVTTLTDLGAKGSLTFRLRDAMAMDIVRGPRLVLSGRALTITGGHGWPWLGEADGVDGVRLAVRKLCKEGADLIKLMMSGGGTPGTDSARPSFSAAEVNAIVDEAHARNRRVFAHVTNLRAIEMALDAGVDMLVHCQQLTPEREVVYDDKLVDRILETGAYVNPTLQINRIGQTRVSWETLSPERATTLKHWQSLYPKFQENFQRMSELGVPMVCGSDCGWGYSTFRESYLEVDAMAAAGAPVTEALFAATGRAADALGLGKLTGRLEAGLKADVLVVEGDATTDTKALGKVREVWREGAPMFGKSPFGPLKW